MGEPVVYLLWCRGDGSLYTGWTSDLTRRVAAHQRGRGARYTRSRLPVELAAAIPMPDARAARREEARIKRLSRAAKLALVAAQPCSCSATPATTSATPATSTAAGTCASTTIPITVAVAGSSETISA